MWIMGQFDGSSNPLLSVYGTDIGDNRMVQYDKIMDRVDEKDDVYIARELKGFVDLKHCLAYFGDGYIEILYKGYYYRFKNSFILEEIFCIDGFLWLSPDIKIPLKGIVTDICGVEGKPMSVGAFKRISMMSWLQYNDKLKKHK